MTLILIMVMGVITCVKPNLFIHEQVLESGRECSHAVMVSLMAQNNVTTLTLMTEMGVITCVKLNLIMNVLELDQLLVILFVVTVLLIQVKNVMMET